MDKVTTSTNAEVLRHYWIDNHGSVGKGLLDAVREQELFTRMSWWKNRKMNASLSIMLNKEEITQQEHDDIVLALKTRRKGKNG